MKKNVIKIIIGVLIGAVVIGGGYFGYSSYTGKQKTSTTATSYIAMQANKRNLSVNVQSTGVVVAQETRDVAANSNGNLKDFSLKVGDTVKAGSKIATVTTSDQTQNTVTKAENNVSKLKIQLSTSQNSLQNAKTQLATAQKDLTDAQIQLNTATGQDVKTLNDKIANLQNQINTQNNNISNFQNQIATQNINISDGQNDLNAAIAQKGNADIVAPIDGVVTVVNNGNGDAVQQGKALLSLVNTNSYKIKVSVDELDIAKIKKGGITDVTFGALKDKKFTGKVDTVSLVGTTTNNVTTYDVLISLDSAEGVQLGMTASVNIQVENKDNALVIPAEALTEKGGKKFVMIPNENGDGASTSNTQSQQAGQKQKGQTYSSGKLVEITTGIQNENYVEVLSGIEDGQKVLVMLPKNTSGTNQNMRQGGFGGQGGGFGGQGGQRNAGGSSDNKTQKSGTTKSNTK